MAYDLCLVRTAVHPFEVKPVCTEVYTIEELCYIFYHNPDLADDTVMGAPLCDWVKQELGLERLSASLRSQIMRNDSAGSIILSIFREVGYLSGDELRSFSELLNRLDAQPQAVKRKRYGDALTRNRMYAKAARVYMELLDDQENKSLGAQFYADVRNNLGSVYAAQFRYREAAGFYYQAWKTGKKRDCLRRYLSTLPLFLSDEAYQEKLKEEGIDTEFARSVQERNAQICRKAGASAEAERILQSGLPDYLKKQRDLWRKSMAG